MGNLPHSGAALEAIGVSTGEDQLDGGAAFLLAPMNSEKVAFAVRDIAVDLDQFVGDVMASAIIPDQRFERPRDEIGGLALEQPVIVGRVGMVDAVEQLR